METVAKLMTDLVQLSELPTTLQPADWKRLQARAENTVGLAKLEKCFTPVDRAADPELFRKDRNSCLLAFTLEENCHSETQMWSYCLSKNSSAIHKCNMLAEELVECGRQTVGSLSRHEFS